jgi:hypothetical protein
LGEAREAREEGRRRGRAARPWGSRSAGGRGRPLTGGAGLAASGRERRGRKWAGGGFVGRKRRWAGGEGRRGSWAARAGMKGREREGLESFFPFFSTILQLFKLLKFKLLFKLFKIQLFSKTFKSI